jgi:hypothetical protein
VVLVARPAKSGVAAGASKKVMALPGSPRSTIELNPSRGLMTNPRSFFKSAALAGFLLSVYVSIPNASRAAAQDAQHPVLTGQAACRYRQPAQFGSS